jgi:peptide chain release factor 2
MEKYEVNKTLEAFDVKIKDLENALNIEKINQRLKEIEPIMGNPNFWNDSNNAKRISLELNQLTQKKQTITTIKNQYEDALMWLLEAKEGTESWEVLEDEIASLQEKISVFEIEVLLNGEYDHNNAILELHPGAGGTESMDWCSILMRMYERFAANKGYKVEILNYLAGEEAGVKSVTLRISGAYAYGNLKSERGVHRLVRISPFDSNKRRHTSFVSCDIAPEIDETSDIELKDDDIRMDTFQSSGAGGQSVNTTYSAVRLTHMPSGIVVSIQNERSQIKNKDAAMQILKSKLIQKDIEEKQAKLNALKGEKSDIGWGSQIRSYVFQPYQMVKDHRTNYEVGNIQSVMDGDIDGFINAYLKSKKYE